MLQELLFCETCDCVFCSVCTSDGHVNTRETSGAEGGAGAEGALAMAAATVGATFVGAGAEAGAGAAGMEGNAAGATGVSFATSALLAGGFATEALAGAAALDECSTWAVAPFTTRKVSLRMK